MTDVTNTQIPESNEDLVQDELATLKARADQLGIKYHPSISLATLKQKLEAALKDEPEVKEGETAVPSKEKAPEKTQAQLEAEARAKARQDANRLIRIRVTCMNPAKKEWEGEIFTVANAVVGTLSKFVPFNAEDGWHVPYMIYEMIKERKCQIFVDTRDGRGNKIRKGKTISEFAIEVLDPLTEEELHDLAQRQAMAGSIG